MKRDFHQKNEPFDTLAVLTCGQSFVNRSHEIMKSLCIACLTTASVIFSASGEQFRTDINPALLYYQAFLLAPDLEPADRDFLWAHGTPGEILPEKFGELMAKYDGQFTLVRSAARSTAPCDWGIDRSAGPSTFLPHLARAKAVVQTARFRAIWAFQQGRTTDACDDLVAAFVLGKNISRDGTTISVLVQLAIEALVCSAVAENFWQFTPDTLQRLADGFEAAPARGTVAASIVSEKSLLRDWTVRKIQDLQRQNPGDDARVMEGIHEFMTPKDPHVALAETDFWGHLTIAAGGTSDGMLKLLEDRERVYQKFSTLLTLPYAEYENQLKTFSAEFQDSSNPFVSASVPSLLRARSREFRILATMSMVRAAIGYKLHGETALLKWKDPCGNGPFSLRRFVFEGMDRGFVLRSAYYVDGDDSGALIFVEKAGPPFRVSGRQIGTPLSKESAEDAFRKRYGLDQRK